MATVNQDIFAALSKMLTDCFCLDEEVQLTDQLEADYEGETADFIELAFKIRQYFKIECTADEVAEQQTVADLLSLIESRQL